MTGMPSSSRRRYLVRACLRRLVHSGHLPYKITVFKNMRYQSLRRVYVLLPLNGSHGAGQLNWIGTGAYLEALPDFDA